MMINYGTFLPVSTIEDFGHASAVVFLGGCKLNCWYCHNRHLMICNNIIDDTIVRDFIKASSPIVSSVTFSGGEPLLQPDSVERLIDYSKKLGLEVCLYTSGNYPNELGQIASKIDRCYIDFKLESALITVPYTKYVDNVLQSINILNQTGVKTFITVTIFDVEPITISEINEIKRITGKTITVTQGMLGRNKPVSLEEMKTFKGCWIRTKENGMEWIE